MSQDRERLIMQLEEYRREVEEATGLTYNSFVPGFHTREVEGKRTYAIGIRKASYTNDSPLNPFSYAHIVSEYWATRGYECETMGTEESGEIVCHIPEVGTLSFGYGPAGLATAGITLPA